MTCKFAFLGALVAAAGCASVAVDGGAVATPEKKGPAQPLAKVRIDSARNTKYGVWVGKGPRILDADGNPLLDAQVHFRDDPEMFRFGLDEDARVVVNRYLDTYNRCRALLSCLASEAAKILHVVTPWLRVAGRVGFLVVVAKLYRLPLRQW